MNRFIFTPANVRDPMNHPHRIYFSCHPNDMAYFDMISKRIRAVEADCVIAYAAPDGEETVRLEELGEFHLTVIPITEDWFLEGSHRREFDRLVKANRAILPILLDNSVEQRFNDTTDKLQFLRNGDPDFSEKLQRALQNILFDSELLDQVHAVFTHKMFVSYCREDMEEVRRLIQCIHSEESGKRIAIWYDKYLPMGKNFEESIFAQLDDSHFFAVTTTPNLFRRDNYVKQYEYPYAQKSKKEIIFFELSPVDKANLAQFEKAEEHTYISVEHTKELAELVRRLAQETPGNSTQPAGAETDYLLGLAYQNGLFVEFDYSFAVQKFKAAANARYADAAHAIANMYYYGQGIPRDEKKAASWYKREVSIVEERFQDEVNKLRQLKKEPAISFNTETGEIVENDVGFDNMQTVIQRVYALASDLMVRCGNNARLLRDGGGLSKAEQLYRIALRALDLIDSTANRLAIKEKYRGRVENEMNIMLLMANRADAAAIERTWLYCREQYNKHPKAYLNLHSLLFSAHNYGLVLMQQKNPDKAQEIMQQVLDAAQKAWGNPEIYEDRPVYELVLTLCRDVGRTYIMDESLSGVQREENAHKALRAFEIGRQLLKGMPFDVDENPYLYSFLPWNLFHTGEAYDYAGDNNHAAESYLKAYSQMSETEKTMGNLAEMADFPITFLQFYTACLQKLARYGYDRLRPVICDMIERTVQRYGEMRFVAAHAPRAKGYLQTLREILEYLQSQTD